MLALISDIHGNHAALKAVLADIDRQGIKQIVCLGDVGGYYCQVNECIATLRERKIFTLMGNHDGYLAFNTPCERSNSANRCLDYQRRVITDENLAWLAALEEQGQVGELRLIHGGWNDPLEEYLRPSAEYFAQHEGRYFASGHTHVPCIWQEGDKTYCNPGSVGQPRDGDPRAAYALWDGEAFTLCRVSYDIKATQDAMREAGFDPYFYENLAIGSRIGGKIDSY